MMTGTQQAFANTLLEWADILHKGTEAPSETTYTIVKHLRVIGYSRVGAMRVMSVLKMAAESSNSGSDWLYMQGLCAAVARMATPDSLAMYRTEYLENGDPT